MAMETTAPGSTTDPRDERRTTAWIGSSLRIEGKITSRENLTIDGDVEGSIEVGGRGLLIGAGASVKADLVAGTITISGTVIGNIVAADKVDIRSTGSIEGDIVTPRLVMAEGAVVSGRIDAGHPESRAPVAQALRPVRPG